MSETVHYRGKLTKIKSTDPIELQCKKILNNQELPPYFDTYQKLLLDEFYEEYVIFNNALYSVEKEEIIPYDDIFFRSSPNIDGTINFEVRYYNGACGLDEAIEMALKEN